MRSSVRVTLAVLGIAICGTAGPALSDDAHPESDELWVEERRLEIGDIRAGSEVLGTFIFHNDGEKDVRIIRAKPS